MSADSRSEPIELELKYVVDDVHTAQDWVDSTFPRQPGGRWRRFRIVDRYFDTADRSLLTAGYGVRLRRTAGNTVLTVKSDLEVSGGRHRRLELEAPATQSLAWRRWPESEARSRVAAAATDAPLIESFVVLGVRREREIELDGAAVVVSIDDALVEWCGAPAGELRQVEFELRDGPAAVLDRIAALAAANPDLSPESRSKLAMAAELAEAAARVTRDDAFAEAGRKVLRRHLVRMLERERVLRAGDPNALKQMRVATRRMRAAWRVFGEAFRKRDGRRYVAELRRVALALGAVRDMDVLLARLPRKTALAPLADTWRAQRDAAWQDLVALLDSAEYRRFVRDYLDLTGTRGAGVARRRPQATLRDEVPGRVAQAEARLQAAGAAAQHSEDDAGWHALRIAGKRLRYTLESFREALDEPAATARIDSLRSFQDLLGEMNDAAVAANAASTWLEEHPEAADATRRAVEHFVVASRESVARERSRFESVRVPLTKR